MVGLFDEDSSSLFFLCGLVGFCLEYFADFAEKFGCVLVWRANLQQIGCRSRPFARVGTGGEVEDCCGAGGGGKLSGEVGSFCFSCLYSHLKNKVEPEEFLEEKIKPIPS